MNNGYNWFNRYSNNNDFWSDILGDEKDGDYKIIFSYKHHESLSEWKNICASNNYILVSKRGNKYTTDTYPHYKLSASVEFSGRNYVGALKTAHITITNEGDEFNGDVCMNLTNPNGEIEVWMDNCHGVYLETDQSIEYGYFFNINQLGVYSFSLAYHYFEDYITIWEGTMSTETEIIPITEIRLPSSPVVIRIGEKVRIDRSILPSDATNKELVWESNNENIVIVDSEGYITGITAGNATISAKSMDGSEISATCSVIVESPIYISSINLCAEEIQLSSYGGEVKLSAQIWPENASLKKLNWVCDDETIAKVDQNGIVKAVSEGTARISAKATDGSGVVAYCLVSVVSSVIFDFKQYGIYYRIIDNTCEVTLKNIGDASYSDQIVIPSGILYNNNTYNITTIGYKAFYNCSKLTYIYLPSTIKDIKENAFYGCTKVKTINCESKIPPVCGIKALEGISRTDCVIKVPRGCLSAYKLASPWREFSNIEDGSGSFPDNDETCIAPTISVVKGQLYIESSTFNSKCLYSITSDDKKSGEIEKNSFIPISGQYEITAYATAEGLNDSEIVMATLIWSNPSIKDANVLNMDATRAVVISSTGSGVRVSGTEPGEIICVHSVDGNLLNKTIAKETETIVECHISDVIVKVGDKSVKIKI